MDVNAMTARRLEGFTMIELLIVFALLLIMTALGATLLQGVYPEASVGDVTRNLEQSLRSAQIQSYAGRQGASVYGVQLGEENLVLYKGASFVTRDPEYDVSFPLGEITLTPSFVQQSVQFDRSGAPSVTGTIVVAHSVSDDIETIRIHEYGIVRE